jgi:muramoyltetrapeptide carboxypeptidase
VVTGLPFGHIRDKVTIPVGARCSLDVHPNAFSLRLSGYRLTA